MRHIAGHALQRSSASSASFIWISDTLLAQSIQRFGRLHCRHGSSTPGPLEARKRATRRKNASLAAAGHLAPPNDVGILFGHGQNAGWWKAPDSLTAEVQPVEAQPATVWPSWFSQSIPTLPEEDFPQSTPPRHAHEQFQLLLPGCQTLQQIRDLVQHLEIDLPHTPAYSREILLHLLNRQGGFCETHDFMLDGTLHTPGSSCFDELMLWCVVHPQTTDQLASLYVCLQKSLSLGLAQNREVKMILTRLPSIKVKRQAAISQLGDTDIIQGWYSMMANAMIDCPVFCLKDLDESELKQWSSCVVTAPFSVVALKTFNLLHRYLSKLAEGFTSRIAAELITKWMASRQQGSSCPPDQSNESSPKDDLGRLEISNFLQNLKPTIAAQTMYQVTQGLVSDSVTHSSREKNLEVWRQVLSTLSRSSAVTILRRRRWKEFHDQNDAAVILSLRKNICIRLWTAVQVASETLRSDPPPSVLDLIQHLVRYFKRQLRPEEDLLAQLILSFRSLPLQSYLDVLGQIARSSTLHFQVYGCFEKLDAVLSDSSKARVSLFNDDKVYQRAKQNLNTHLGQLAERTNTDPQAFLKMAHALVLRDKISSKTISRILKNNLALNLALAHATTNPRHRQNWSAQVNDTPIPISAEQNPPLPMTPSLALHVYTSIARSFAITPALNPSEAFRKVYWVYLHVHRHTGGGGVTPGIVRALWYAGVARQRRTGTSRDKVEWILHRVAQVEGQDVADRLLWFGARDLKRIGWNEWIDVDVKRELQESKGGVG